MSTLKLGTGHKKGPQTIQLLLAVLVKTSAGTAAKTSITLFLRYKIKLFTLCVNLIQVQQQPGKQDQLSQYVVVVVYWLSFCVICWLSFCFQSFTLKKVNTDETMSSVFFFHLVTTVNADRSVAVG